MSSQNVYFINPNTVTDIDSSLKYSYTGYTQWNQSSIPNVTTQVNDGRRVFRIEGDMQQMKTKDTEHVLNPSLRQAAAVVYPQLNAQLTDATLSAALTNVSDQYARWSNEMLVRAYKNYTTEIAGSMTMQQAGFNWPNGPIPASQDTLREAAVQKVPKYLSAYFDEVDAGDGRADGVFENIRALRRYRIIPKNLTSYSGAFNYTPGATGPYIKNYPGQMQGRFGTPAFDLSLQLKLSSTTGANPLGTTTINVPNPIYVTPFAAQKWYGGNSDDISGVQGATDANIPYCQSALCSYSIEQMRSSAVNNFYYYAQPPFTTNGTGATVNLAGQSFATSSSKEAPMGMYQIYVFGDNDVNMSVMARAKAAGCSALMYTLDAGHGHTADRMLELGSNIPGSDYAGGVFFSDPVFNYKLYISLAGGVPRACVATTDLNVLAYASSKLGIPASTLASTININKAMDFFAGGILGAIRQQNVFKSEADCLAGGAQTGAYLYSIHYMASKAHSTGSISDAYPSTGTNALPILIKGMSTAEEALASLDSGADGVIVSNHGGRFYDQARSSLDSLQEIYPAVKAVNPNFGVWFDSGIRRAPDVLVAMANGAEFIGVGRPCQYANVLAGRVGVRQVLQRLVYGIRRHAQIAGLPHLQNIDLTRLILQKSVNKDSTSISHTLWN